MNIKPFLKFLPVVQVALSLYFFLFGGSSQLSKLRMSGLVFLCGEEATNWHFSSNNKKKTSTEKNTAGTYSSLPIDVALTNMLVQHFLSVPSWAGIC